MPALLVAQSQPATSTLKGQVTDPSGAVIPGATITLHGPDGKSTTATSDAAGEYLVHGLTPGIYKITVTADGFSRLEILKVDVGAGTKALAIALKIAVENQQVEVQAEAPTVDVSAENNATSTILRGKDLESLSDDPDEMQSELEALAGPSAGPNGGQMYIDGFTGGQLPPKSSIREVRINSNPFSSEYDKMGYGRIEIFTKPGMNQWHGQLQVNGNAKAFNANNPFISKIPDYYSDIFNGNLSGPLGKRASFFVNGEVRNIDNASVSNYTTSNATFGAGPGTTCTPAGSDFTCSVAVSNPRLRYNLSGRLDFQLTPSNTLTGRYQYTHNSETNDIAGQQFLTESQLYDTGYSEHALQMSDTQTVSSHVINETRFQYRHMYRNNHGLDFSPTITVAGSFTGGGASMGATQFSQNNYEIQNYTSIQNGKHYMKFGGRVRATTDDYTTNGNFNGTYIFPTLAAFTAGTPSQYSVTAGQPTVGLTWADLGLYAEDEWRVKPTLSLTYGLRYETQNVISDHRDFAPRLGVSWGINPGKNKTPRTVVRAGFGIFYDRFEEGQYLTTQRLNGVAQQQYIVYNPAFYPTAPPPATLAASTASPTVYKVGPALRSPYTLQSALSVEHQLAKSATLSLTYLNSRGFDQLLTNNINAPLPGTYTPGVAGTGTRPFGNVGNIYQYQSEGIFRQNQLIANTNVRLGARLTLGGFYTLSFANSDANGGFPSNPYNLMADYGPASYNVRHRVMVFGSMGLSHGIRLSPMMVFNTGAPFSITSGEDVNGDSIFNDRPALASGPATSFAGPGLGGCPHDAPACQTPWGIFNLVPGSGTPTIRPNYLTGPSQFMLNLRLAKTFGFGKVTGSGGGGGGGGDHDHGPRGGGLGGRGLGGGGGMGGFFGGADDRHRYQITVSAFGRNLLNNVNLVPPVATLTSPLIGTSNGIGGGFFGGSAANRRIDFSVSFSF